MNSKIKNDPIWSLARETASLPSADVLAPPQVCRPRRDQDDGTGPHLTSETQALLSFRLRAAALILLVGFTVFLVRHVAGVLTGEPLDPLLLGFHVLVVLVLGCSTTPLFRHYSMSTRHLRVAELVIFGLPDVFFLMLQHRTTLQAAGRGFMPTPMAFWVLLISTYAMFIPNSWRRAAVTIGTMALAPLLLVIGMMFWYPAVVHVMTVADFMQHVLVMAVAAVAAVSGTHAVNSLRREAFEARRLAQYRLIAPLGAGGMGEVYLAEHCMLKRPCAIKLIHPDRAGDSQVLARFEREVRTTAQLSHWNTVEIFDYGRTADGTFFYVMEYLPGLSLEDLLERHGPQTPACAVALLRQACHALGEAHAIGLIHRDIKPGNIFVAERGGQYDVVKLLDFGLVKPVVETPSVRLTQDGAISGTPLYMSPEQARRLPELDARSDIYSLGAVAYALLTGNPPFDGSNPLDVMIAHARDDVIPLSRRHPHVPADLERIILRCLAKRPEDRFQDVQSLEQALGLCAAADQWTQSNAALWWQQHDQTGAASRESTTRSSRRSLLCAGTAPNGQR